MREMNTLTTKAMYNSCYGNSVLQTANKVEQTSEKEKLKIV